MKFYLLFIFIFFVACHDNLDNKKPINEITPLPIKTEVPVQTPIATPIPTPTKKPVNISDIINISDLSSCMKYNWKDRGHAPKGYIRGMAIMYAKALCNPQKQSVVASVVPAYQSENKDALVWYKEIFKNLGIENKGDDVETLRSVYALAIGLGMRESSGRHCCGRDGSATNTSSETAEAGLFQTSYNSRSAHPELVKLFNSYQDGKHCLLNIFKDGVSCNSSNWLDWGEGNGLLFQTISKNCPAFTVEYVAIMLRNSGGAKGHYGPLRTRAAEVRLECINMLKDIEIKLLENASYCDAINNM